MHHPSVVRYTFLVAGIVGLLFGLFFLLAAGQAIASYELGPATVPARLFARSAGAAIIGLSVANLLAMLDRGSRALWALAVGNVVVHVLAIAVEFSENYPRNLGTWVGLAIHVILITAFVYCLVHWRQIWAGGEGPER
jgi:hypothetical protein